MIKINVPPRALLSCVSALLASKEEVFTECNYRISSWGSSGFICVITDDTTEKKYRLDVREI